MIVTDTKYVFVSSLSKPRCLNTQIFSSQYLCQKKAASQGIRTASLPIGKYLKELKTRKVLTVNQVFEILIHWVDSKNWEDALYSVMPKRKFTQESNAKPQGIQAAMDGNVIEVDEAEPDEEEEEGAENERRSDTE